MQAAPHLARGDGDTFEQHLEDGVAHHQVMLAGARCPGQLEAAGIKLVAVSLTILLTARWIGGELFNFTLQLFESIPTLGR